MATEQRDPRDGAVGDQRDARQLGEHADRRDRRVVSVDPRDERRPGDSRDERTVLDLPQSVLSRSAPAAIIVGGYALLGLSLVCEPARWSRTPAYADLLALATQRTWGTLLLVIAGLLAATTWLTGNRTASLLAHFVAALFTAGWMLAFLVRYLTDPTRSTTPMNAVMWSIAWAVLVYSMLTTAKYRSLPPSPPPGRYES